MDHNHTVIISFEHLMNEYIASFVIIHLSLVILK